MATIFGTSINDSATVVFPAAAKIEGVQGIALALADGKLSVPEAGKAVLGLSLFTNEENVEAGADVDVQIKDIGKWVIAEKIAAGDELAADATGKAVKAKDGDFVVGIALSSGEKAGSIVRVQIIKTYKGGAAGAAGAATTKLTDLTDVSISGEGEGHVLTYEGGTWKNKAPAEKGLNDLSDVEISGPSADQVLKYDDGASKWKNQSAE